MSHAPSVEKDTRSILRSETRELHDRVDRLMSIERISTPGGYARMLCIHGAILPPVERFLVHSGHLDDLPQLEARLRTHALEADLADLGLEMPPQANMSLVNSKAGAAGLMYVIEGTRLGAQLILRRLDRERGVARSAAFLGHGETKAFWPSFVTWLNGRDWGEEELRDMRHAASGLFRAYADTAAGLEGS